MIYLGLNSCTYDIDRYNDPFYTIVVTRVLEFPFFSNSTNVIGGSLPTGLITSLKTFNDMHCLAVL